MLQGLSDRIAEDLAGHLHGEWRNALGLSAGTGTRWSPGYPGMRAMTMNRVILECLDAERLLGVRLTEADQFSPTGSTAAVISFHPEARYT